MQGKQNDFLRATQDFPTKYEWISIDLNLCDFLWHFDDFFKKNMKLLWNIVYLKRVPEWKSEWAKSE